MTARLAAIGLAAPTHTQDQQQLAGAAARLCDYTPAQLRLLHRFYDHSTIQSRAGVAFAPDHTLYTPHQSPSTAQRLAAYPRAAQELASRAAAEALRRQDAHHVTHLITASCTGFAAPGVDVHLVDSLGLAPDVHRTAVGFMGCHGALNALRVARAFVEADPASVALVVAVELCSLHFYYGWDPEKVLANALFADGAAAALIKADSQGATGARLIDNAASIIPETRDAMTWTIGDHGFEMTLAREVPEIIRTRLESWLTPWLASHNLTPADVAGWAVHPGGPRILDAVADALDLSPEQTRASRDVLAEHGNMSSPTILYILERLQTRGPVVALGFGPGLAIEAALLHV